MKPSKITKTNDVGFDDVRQWFDQHMRVGKLDLDDQEVYKNVYHQAKWCGIFQCVDEATPITMSDGSIKLIKDVVPGDYVKSFNIDTREFENDLVLNVFDQGIKDCVQLETGFVDQKLICTADHPLLTQSESGRFVWKPASSIPHWLICYEDDKTYDYAHICDFSSKAGKHHVNDIEVENNHNFVADGIVVHNCTSRGAQKFFERSKPKSIDDIAVLTSIYRPGPLAAKIDDLWAKALEGEEYDWGDKRINKILEKTRGLLIFQEGVMMLAELVAGFPKDKCDEVRRAIMKRTISGGDAAKAKVDQLKIDFVEGSMKNGYTKSVAENLYEKIAFFAGYAFNKSHAISYAIDSYYCAWLLTHYEPEWLCAYLETMSGNPEDKERAISEIKSLGYKIVPIDINIATKDWSVLPNKRLMPSFLTCKGVGEAAVDEIFEHRPYKNIYDLLWNADGSWKHSKFNKRGFESLIKLGAFQSMDLIGEGKTFSSYKHMHHILVENMDLIKKTTKKEPGVGLKNFDMLLKSTIGMEEWTKEERIDFYKELVGDLNLDILVSDELRSKLQRMGVKSIEEWENKEIYWFVVTDVVLKQTKNGKNYLLISAVGNNSKQQKIFCWNGGDPEKIKKNCPYVAELDKSDFGYSTSAFKLKEIRT